MAEQGLRSPQAQPPSPALPLTSFVAPGKSARLSEPRHPLQAGSRPRPLSLALLSPGAHREDTVKSTFSEIKNATTTHQTCF